MRPGALESLQWGVLNLRANRELVALIWLERCLMVLLTLASLAPFLWVLEIRLPWGLSTPDELLSWLGGLSEQLADSVRGAPFWMAVIASSAVLMLVLFVVSFFQAGAFGVLTRGELRAVHTRDRAVGGFRSFTWEEFQKCGGRHLWRFFWLFNLLLLLWTAWLLLLAFAGLASGLAMGSAGAGVGLAVGCVAIVPLAFAAVVLAFWSWFAQAEIAARDCSVWVGLLNGLWLTTRRLGAVIVLATLLAVVLIGTTVVFLLLAVTLDAGLAGLELLGIALAWILRAVQWLVSGVIHLIFAGTVVSLACGEHEVSRIREASA